jgi:hypothetical protein
VTIKGCGSGRSILDDVAKRHGVSLDAAVTLLGALEQGNATFLTGTERDFSKWF